MVASLVSYDSYSETILVVCNCLLELLSKDYSGSFFVMVLFLGLTSLLKLVIELCLNYGLCEYSTYRLTLLVSLASVPTPCFNPMGFYVNYHEILEFSALSGKALSCWIACYNLTVTVAW
jgi:hypothetical protein